VRSDRVVDHLQLHDPPADGEVGEPCVLRLDWTGGSFNPARQLGPALLSGRTAFLWWYLAGPLAGAAFLELSRCPGNSRPVTTCQLCSA
jgi:Major intrinsic protein